MKEHYDVIIVGTGAAGLYCALNLPEKMKILLITKQEADQSDSFLAQGGICMLRGEDDYENYFEDTMRAGHYENNKRAVDLMIRSSNDIIRDLLRYHVDFARDGLGNLAFTREGAHSQPRILFHEDITGKEITSKLLAAVKKCENVKLLEYTTMIDLLTDGKTCAGAVTVDKAGTKQVIEAEDTVLACGGLGGLYEHSTNFRHLTGDALAIALSHDIQLENIDYIQIHPTTLYSKKPGRRFLISESVRGEGAILLDKNGNRFVNELLPRDLLTKKEYEQMKKDDMPYVRLSLAPIKEEEIKGHFPNIYRRCLEEGYDVTTDPIPVVPAQHYFMGGIWVDSEKSRTSAEHLYAIGETSCNGVHGANRLASNSLLESLVFAGRAAKSITENPGKVDETMVEKLDLNKYEDLDKLREEYKKLVLDEIERVKEARKGEEQ